MVWSKRGEGVEGKEIERAQAYLSAVTDIRTMKPALTVVTLGVGDLERSLAFYRDGLRWPTSSKEEDGIAFFQLDNGVVLALYPRDSLAKDAAAPPREGGFPGFTLAHNAGSEEEVDAIFAELKALGASVVKEPERAFWGGYSGYFADPDGFLWEVVYNPTWRLDGDGSVVLG